MDSPGPARKKPRSCSACGSRKIATILYGLPAFSPKQRRDLDAGKIVLGGCCIGPRMPVWQCADCGESYGERKD